LKLIYLKKSATCFTKVRLVVLTAFTGSEFDSLADWFNGLVVFSINLT